MRVLIGNQNSRFLFLVLILGIFSNTLAQQNGNLSGNTVSSNVYSCGDGSGFRIDAFAGYFGSVDGSFPKAGDQTAVYVFYSIVGSVCATFEGVYVELLLPSGAEVTNPNGLQCFRNGINVTSSSEVSCRVFNEQAVHGGLVLGTNLLATGQSFQYRVPVRFNQELSGNIGFAVQGTPGIINPIKSINVPYDAQITYPTPSAVAISSNSATVRAQIKNNFRAGNAFIDFGTSPSYGTTSAAIPIPSGSAFDIEQPLQNLSPATTYHWRIRFVTSTGQSFFGANQSFTTAAAAPPPPAESFQLTVNKTGNGAGSVSSLPLGINCLPNCESDAAAFVSGETVRLFAVPAEGSSFTGWSGACSGTAISCEFTMSQARTVTATFSLTTLPPNTLPLSVVIDGEGTVNSSPEGISCTNECTADFDTGTVVRLFAVPKRGHEFVGWTGDCSGTRQCQVTMTQARSVKATFNALGTPAPEKGSLRVNIRGVPAGIADVTVTGSGFSERLTGSTTLSNLVPGAYTITAASVLHNGFVHSPTQTSQSVTVVAGAQESIQVSYTINLPPPADEDENATLILQLEGDGSGTVSSDPGGISCGPDCVASYPKGTVITLTANPSEDSEFTGWSGSCATFAVSCSITLTDNETIVASFNQIPGLTDAFNQRLLMARGATQPDLSRLETAHDIAVLQLVATSEGEGPLWLESLIVTGTASVSGADGLTAIKLYRDVNSTGRVDSGDVLLATTSLVSLGEGAELILSDPLELGIGESMTLLVAVDVRPNTLAGSMLTMVAVLVGFGFLRRGARARSLSLVLALTIYLSSCNTVQNNPVPETVSYQLTVTGITATTQNPGQTVVVDGLPLVSQILTLKK